MLRLDIKRNRFFAAFSNLGLGDVPIEDEYPEKYDRLLCGGIWCIVQLNYREKWLLLTRMIPLVENNFNLCELGSRSTGKSHLFKEISPNSILVSGGQTTVATAIASAAPSARPPRTTSSIIRICRASG